MAFTQEELEQYRKIVNAYIEKRRPPMHLRHQADLSFRIKNQSIEIFDIRPRLDDPLKTVEIPIAKTTWVNTQKVWRIFWHRADMRWHRYAPLPQVKTLEEFIDAVEADEYACFYG
jgi:Flp pilus assembly CpaF family ATPase